MINYKYEFESRSTQFYLVRVRDIDLAVSALNHMRLSVVSVDIDRAVVVIDPPKKPIELPFSAELGSVTNDHQCVFIKHGYARRDGKPKKLNLWVVTSGYEVEILDQSSLENVLGYDFIKNAHAYINQSINNKRS